MQFKEMLVTGSIIIIGLIVAVLWTGYTINACTIWSMCDYRIDVVCVSGHLLFALVLLSALTTIVDIILTGD